MHSLDEASVMVWDVGWALLGASATPPLVTAWSSILVCLPPSNTPCHHQTSTGKP